MDVSSVNLTKTRSLSPTPSVSFADSSLLCGSLCIAQTVFRARNKDPAGIPAGSPDQTNQEQEKSVLMSQKLTC